MRPNHFRGRDGTTVEMAEFVGTVPEVADLQAGVRQHVIAALLASLRRTAALEALILQADPVLLAAERAAIREIRRVPVGVA